METGMTKDPEDRLEIPQHQVMQNLRLRLRNAPFWKRAIAFCTDQAIISAAFYLLFLIGSITLVPVLIAVFAGLKGILPSAEASKIPVLIGVLLLTLVIFALFHSYFIYFEYKGSSTPGKRLFGLKVVSTDGRKLTLRQCILREVMRTVDLGLVFPGLISYFATEKRQRLGDILASTWVVHSEEKEKERSFLYLSQDDYLYIKSLLQPNEVNASFRHEFLTFSSDCFLFKRSFYDSDQMENWRQQVSRYIPNIDQHDIDTKSLLLFFAEHCYQTQLTEQHSQGENR